MWPTTRREARREARRGGLFFEFGQRLRAAGLNEKSPDGVGPCACPPGGDDRPPFTDAPTAIILSKLEKDAGGAMLAAGQAKTWTNGLINLVPDDNTSQVNNAIFLAEP